MKRALLAIGSIASALVLTGCVESSTVVHVNRDGSGRVVVREFFSPQITQMLQMAALQESGGENRDFLEQMIVAKAAQMGAGVERVRSEQIENAGGWKGFEAEYRFADVRRLRLRIGDGPSTEAPGEGDDDESIRFDFQPGTPARLVVRQPPVADAGEGADAAGGEEMNEAMMQMVTPMLQGMRITFRVAVDGRISETNGQYVAEDRASLTVLDLPMERVMANADAMRIIARQSPDAPARLAALGIEGVRIEPPGKAVEISF